MDHPLLIVGLSTNSLSQWRNLTWNIKKSSSIYLGTFSPFILSKFFRIHVKGSWIESRNNLGFITLFVFAKGDYFLFGLIFIKKSNQTKIFYRNRVKPTGFGSVRFFRAKTGSNRFGSVFPVLARFSRFWLGFFRFWLGFFRFCSVFSVFLGFGSVFFRFFVGFGSVWFFRFFAYKTETKPVGFFKNLICFFFVWFF